MKNLFLSNNVLSFLLYTQISKESNTEIYLTTNPKSKEIINEVQNKLYGKKFKVFFELIKIIIKSYFQKYNTIFIGYPNIVSVLIMKFSNYDNLCYIDDGTTFYEVIDKEETMYVKQMKEKKIKTLLYKFMGINTNSLILTKAKKLKKLIVFMPKLYKKSNKFKHFIIEDANKYIPQVTDIGKIWDMSFIINSDAKNIILSQPFNELNITYFGDEVNQVEELINNYPDRQFAIKPHPREKVNKYRNIKNAIIYDSNIPAELILLYKPFDNIYGYYSASMFNVATKQENSSIISLLCKERSKQSKIYFDKVTLLKKYIKNLKILENENECISNMPYL